MREVKVCLIGSGRAGMVHAHNYTGSVPNARIIAVCDPVEETAKMRQKSWALNSIIQITEMS